MSPVHQRFLSNLLAVIHRDGGHYEEEHGTGKAVEDALKLVASSRVVLARLTSPEAIERVAEVLHRQEYHDVDWSKIAEHGVLSLKTRYRNRARLAVETIKQTMLSEVDAHSTIARCDKCNGSGIIPKDGE